MKYISTRGRTKPLGFQDAVITGLAPDGGLLIPEPIPDVTDRLDEWSTLSYQEITFEILKLFVDIPDERLKKLIHRSYAPFSHREIAPATPVGQLQILELFYGPTLAFKDIALQFLSNFFDYILDRTDRQLNILAATSGDTGSAAIHGVKGRERMHIFVMHPHERVAPLQEKQMTSVLDPNVFNLAIKGTFDDCQHIMKALFQDLDFKTAYSLGAVNSVNWARVLAQLVYYFSAGLYVLKRKNASGVRFAVPTGNFGDILAGYYAYRMGLPITKLVLATNENDILSRFFNTGIYQQGEVVPTISPSMDIQVASNFERYLYYKMNEDSDTLRTLMEQFSDTQKIQVPLGPDGKIDTLFGEGIGDKDHTLKTIKKYYEQHNYLLDPHTAVGVYVAEQYLNEKEPMICLATAHPAKFPRAIIEATGKGPGHHQVIDAVMNAPTRCKVLPADEQVVRDFIEKHSVQ